MPWQELDPSPEAGLVIEPEPSRVPGIINALATDVAAVEDASAAFLPHFPDQAVLKRFARLDPAAEQVPVLLAVGLAATENDQPRPGEVDAIGLVRVLAGAYERLAGGDWMFGATRLLTMWGSLLCRAVQFAELPFVLGDLCGFVDGDLDGPGGERGMGASVFPEQEDLAGRQRRLELVDGDRLVRAGVEAGDGEPWQQRRPHSGPYH